jgi:hypothetical protein
MFINSHTAVCAFISLSPHTWTEPTVPYSLFRRPICKKTTEEQTEIEIANCFVELNEIEIANCFVEVNEIEIANRFVEVNEIEIANCFVELNYDMFR